MDSPDYNQDTAARPGTRAFDRHNLVSPERRDQRIAARFPSTLRKRGEAAFRLRLSNFEILITLSS